MEEFAEKGRAILRGGSLDPAACMSDPRLMVFVEMERILMGEGKISALAALSPSCWRIASPLANNASSPAPNHQMVLGALRGKARLVREGAQGNQEMIVAKVMDNKER